MGAPFHLSFCVADLEATRAFYGGVLGCREGSSAPTHIDFAFYGNQLTCHLAPERVRTALAVGLDGNHFGVVLTTEEFVALEQRLRLAEVPFIKAPETQGEGGPRERRKMIFADPSGNAIEIKAYADASRLFG